MPEPDTKIADAIQLQADVEALIERATQLGHDDAIPEDLKQTVAAAVTLDAPRTSRIALALELPEEAPEAHILEAIHKAKGTPDLQTLETHASSFGKRLMDADEVTQLQADAVKGREADQKLQEQTFTLAWDKAMFEGRVDARPETKQIHREIFDRDQDASLRLLAVLPKLVNTEAARVVVTEQPEGDEIELDDRELLHEKVLAYQEEHPGTLYLTALEAVS